MQTTINAHFLPRLVSLDELRGRCVVVIDVLRATTTIAYALEAGARCVVPCLEVAEAMRLRERAKGPVLLGGERGGVKIEGFDLGNSPAEYTPARVADHVLIFTTTNGTRALQHARQAARVLLGSFANFAAILEHARDEKRIELLCAGTEQRISREDVLFAGALVHGLGSSLEDVSLNDEADLARAAWLQALPDPSDHEALATALRHTQGGRNLIRIGQAADIERCARMNQVDRVPQFDLAAGWIV